MAEHMDPARGHHTVTLLREDYHSLLNRIIDLEKRVADCESYQDIEEDWGVRLRKLEHHIHHARELQLGTDEPIFLQEVKKTGPLHIRTCSVMFPPPPNPKAVLWCSTAWWSLENGEMVWHPIIPTSSPLEEEIQGGTRE